MKVELEESMIPGSNSVGKIKREKRLDTVDQRDRFGAMRLVRRREVLRRKTLREIRTVTNRQPRRRRAEVGFNSSKRCDATEAGLSSGNRSRGVRWCFVVDRGKKDAMRCVVRR